MIQYDYMNRHIESNMIHFFPGFLGISCNRIVFITYFTILKINFHNKKFKNITKINSFLKQVIQKKTNTT